MKSIEINGKEITLTPSPMHVAPGGSARYTFTGARKEIFAFLRDLREEVAYGLYDIDVQGEGVKATIYFGLADMADFEAVLQNNTDTQNWGMSRTDLEEGTEGQALSMATRNAILNA